MVYYNGLLNDVIMYCCLKAETKERLKILLHNTITMCIYEPLNHSYIVPIIFFILEKLAQKTVGSLLLGKQDESMEITMQISKLDWIDCFCAFTPTPRKNLIKYTQNTEDSFQSLINA